MEELIHGTVKGLHILALITWIGSMIYSQFAVKPALMKSLADNKSHAVNGLIMKNFESFTWISLFVAIGTGFYLIFNKKDDFTSLTSGAGALLTIKLILVGILVVIFLLQVFVYGPKMKQLLMPSTPKNNETQLKMTKLESTTKLMSWWHLGIGIAIVVLGIILSQILK